MTGLEREGRRAHRRVCPSWPRTRGGGVRLLVALGLGAAPLLAGDGRIPVHVPSPAGTISIASPGSYYLTEDLDYTSIGTGAIDITANDVTLDLAGHVITCSGSVVCVRAIGVSGLRITNGRIRGGKSPVSIIGVASSSSTVAMDLVDVGGTTSSVNVVSIKSGGGVGGEMVAELKGNLVACAGTIGTVGFYLEDLADGVVERNVVRNCGFGIQSVVTGNTVVSHNQVSGNGVGLSLELNHGEILGNLISGSATGSGLEVFGNNNLIALNVASDNQGAGITVDGDRNDLRENTTSENATHGIDVVGDINTLEQNLATANTNCGINVSGDQSLVARNRTPGHPSGGTCTAVTNQQLACGLAATGNASGIQDSGTGNLFCGNLP